MCSGTLQIFYQSYGLRSGLLCGLLGSSIGAGDTNRLDKLIKEACSVIGLKQETFEAVVDGRTLNKLLSIIDNPLHHTVDRQQSSFLSIWLAGWLVTRNWK